MASKYLSAGTATWTNSTRTIAGATMSPVFVQADADQHRPVYFRIGTDLYSGRVETFVSTTSVILSTGGLFPSIDGTIAEIFLFDLSTQRYQAFLDELASLIQDDAAKLSASDLDAVLAKAVTDYSGDKPFYVRKKVTGNGTDLYSPSTIFGSLWKYGYSFIRSIEYPLDSEPGEYLQEGQYEIYDDGSAQDGSNLKLRLNDAAPGVSEYFNVEILAEMDLPVGGTPNFPDTRENFGNITTLAAAYACQRLAAAYAQSTDATITADVVNYHDKSSKYQSLAKQYMKQYNLSVFGKEDAELSNEAAIVSREVPRMASDDRPYIFHTKRTM